MSPAGMQPAHEGLCDDIKHIDPIAYTFMSLSHEGLWNDMKQIHQIVHVSLFQASLKLGLDIAMQGCISANISFSKSNFSIIQIPC